MKTWTSRRRSRGAALVEAGIVAPIFAGIFLMSVYVGGVYETKYRSVNKSRGDGFGFASRNCEGGNGDKSDDGVGNFDQTDGATAGEGSGKGPDIPSDISGAVFTAHVQSTEKFVWWFATNPVGGQQTKTIHSDTFVMCNEKKHGLNVFTYLAQFIGQLSI
ncbi:hypothetical protein BH09MYX1_BH09MYX1_06040 [soil metagenome]